MSRKGWFQNYPNIMFYIIGILLKFFNKLNNLHFINYHFLFETKSTQYFNTIKHLLIYKYGLRIRMQATSSWVIHAQKTGRALYLHFQFDDNLSDRRLYLFINDCIIILQIPQTELNLRNMQLVFKVISFCTLLSSAPANII